MSEKKKRDEEHAQMVHDLARRAPWIAVIVSIIATAAIVLQVLFL